MYNKFIDHTLLKAESTREQIQKIIDEAKQYDFASVCVNAYWVNYCYQQLKDTDVKVCTVVGFPLGATSSAAKAFEAKQAVLDGAKEIDMVINIGEVKGGNFEAVKNDIQTVKEAIGDITLKVIIETCLLTDEEKVFACKAAMAANADFIKTSTGFSTGGATVSDVALMKQTVGEKLKVKASGGVHSKEEMIALIEAGASRIGASSGVKLVSED